MNKNIKTIALEALSVCRDYIGVPITRLIDCGSFGCVFETTNSRQVLKIGMQWNEFHTAQFLLSNDNNVDPKFPVIFNIWNLTECYTRAPLYAILRENLHEVMDLDITWLNNGLAKLESKYEKIVTHADSQEEIIKIAKDILDKNPCSPSDQEEFVKLAKFYADCLDKNILLTDLILNNFGSRNDGTLVLRDLGGAYLYSQI